MAIGYMHFSQCKHALDSYLYAAREGRYKKNQDELVYSETTNLPQCAENDPKKFWKACDKYERGNKAKKVILALPKELTHEQQIELVKKYVNERYPGQVVSIQIHDKRDGNPHVHLQICERTIDLTRPEPKTLAEYFKKTRTRKDGTRSGGYKKDRRFCQKSFAAAEKKAWEKICNDYLRNHGINAKLDFAGDRRRSHGQSVHLGPQVLAAAAKGRWSAKIQHIVDQEAERLTETEKAAEIQYTALVAQTSVKTHHPLIAARAAVKKAAAHVQHAAQIIAHQGDAVAQRNSAWQRDHKLAAIDRESTAEAAESDRIRVAGAFQDRTQAEDKAVFQRIEKGARVTFDELPSQQMPQKLHYNLYKMRRALERQITDAENQINKKVNRYGEKNNIKAEQPRHEYRAADTPRRQRTRDYWKEKAAEAAEAEAARAAAAEEAAREEEKKKEYRKSWAEVQTQERAAAQARAAAAKAAKVEAQKKAAQDKAKAAAEKQRIADEGTRKWNEWHEQWLKDQAKPKVQNRGIHPSRSNGRGGRRRGDRN